MKTNPAKKKRLQPKKQRRHSKPATPAPAPVPVEAPWAKFKLPDLSRFRPENLWFEDKNGNRWTPTSQDLMDCVYPPAHPYQVSRSGCEVRTTFMIRTPKGCKVIATPTSTVSPELVRALTNKIDPYWKDPRSLEKALQIAAMACERCMNILANACGLDWGYAPDSPQAEKCGTTCDLCKTK